MGAIGGILSSGQVRHFPAWPGSRREQSVAMRGHVDGRLLQVLTSLQGVIWYEDQPTASLSS